MEYCVIVTIAFCINFIIFILYRKNISQELNINLQYTWKEFISILFILVLISLVWPLEIMAIITLLVFKYLS